MICPRCCKNTDGIHTCTPSDGWRKLETELAHCNEVRNATMIELERVEAENAALELEVIRLREALEWALCNISAEPFEWCCDEDSESHYSAIAALSTPFAPTALSAMIAKASEAMQQRAISAGSAINPIYGAGAAIDAIRALPTGQINLSELTSTILANGKHHG